MIHQSNSPTQFKTIVLQPTHYLWHFVTAKYDLVLSGPINVTQEEYDAAERDLVKYLKNSTPKEVVKKTEDIVNNNVFIPDRPNDAFIRKFNRLITEIRPYLTVTIHIGSDTQLCDYSYEKILHIIKKAYKNNIIIKTILNGRDINGKNLELALLPSTRFREITYDSSICISVSLIDVISTEAATKAANDNDKIFQFYEKQSPEVAALLKRKEQMVYEYFHKSIMETMQAEMTAGNNSLSAIDSSTLVAKTPGLSIQDLKNSCRTYLDANQCIDFKLFGKINEK